MHEATHSLSPFWWNGQIYSVRRCELIEGQPTVVVDPHCPDLVEAMKRRLFPKPGSSNVYVGFACKCFQEDRKMMDATSSTCPK